MTEAVPEGAPYHPYDDPEKSRKLDPNKPYAKRFWTELKLSDRPHDDRSFPVIEKKELTPEKVIDLFDDYIRNLQQLRQNEQWAQLPNGGKNLDNLTLYDVYLYGLWDTHRSAYYGIPPEARPQGDIARTSTKEQILELVQEAMEQAGHTPKGEPSIPQPK